MSTSQHTLQNLAVRAWKLHTPAAGDPQDGVVAPSMPILYFGNVPRYLASPLRVVTVGLNPSNQEFPTGRPWQRFPDCACLVANGAWRTSIDSYLEGLNRYFTTDPYGWFERAYGHICYGLGVSYSDDADSVAVHTDMCCVSATDPTWTGLTPRQQEAVGDRYRLWHDLVEVLEPDVLLASVAQKHLDAIHFPKLGRGFSVYEVERDNPYVFHGSCLKIGSKRTLLVTGRAANLPFGLVSYEEQRAAGSRIKDRLRGGACLHT